MPIIYGGLLILLSAGLVLQSLFGEPEPALRLAGAGRVLFLAAGTALCVFLWSRSNFLVLFVPATFLATRLLGGSSLASVLTAIAVPGTVFLLFGMALGIPFP